MQQVNDRFNGQKLQLGREFKGWTQKELASRTAASESLLSKYENGKKTDPSPQLVEAFAETLGFLPGFFYGGMSDPFGQAECNFRHRRSTAEKLKTRVRARATLFGLVAEELRQHLNFPELNIPHMRAASLEEAERAAEHARQSWGLSLDAPLLQITRVLERAGVIVVSHHSDCATIDAFSREGKTSVIFLNQAIGSASRWHFDIAHECGHLVMHKGTPTGDEDSERQADRFASAFLMPARAFAREFKAVPSFSWRHIFDLKARWRTSLSAIIRRAYDLKLISSVRYRQANQYIAVKRWRSDGEPLEPAFQQPELMELAFSAIQAEQVSGVTANDICTKLNFEVDTFTELTGVELKAPLRPGPIEMPMARSTFQLAAID